MAYESIIPTKPSQSNSGPRGPSHGPFGPEWLGGHPWPTSQNNAIGLKATSSICAAAGLHHPEDRTTNFRGPRTRPEFRFRFRTSFSFVLNLPPGSALGIFLGRSVGWIAHAKEQYASGEQIRPRA